MYLAFLILSFHISICSTSYVLVRHKSRGKDTQIVENDESAKCEPLTIPACKKLNYNATRLPKYSDVTSAKLQYIALTLELFQNDRCFENLLFFTCMMYNPICVKNHAKRVLPCRSVCLIVKHECKSAMDKLEIKWPTELDCSSLPDYETDVCIKPNSIITRKNFVSNSADVVISKQKDCGVKCPQPVQIQSFRQFRKSHYAIEAQYISKTKASNGNLRLRFKVVRIFKAGKVPLVKYDFVDIWSNSPCLCVSLEYEKKYMILGKESKSKNAVERRIFLTPETIIMKKNHYLRKTLRKWKRKYRRVLQRKAQELMRLQKYDQSNVARS